MKLSVKIFLGFAIVIILSSIDSIVNYKLSQQVNRNTEFLTRSELIIRNSHRLQRGIIDMQSAFRGYLLTQNDHFLRPYYEELTFLPELFREQNALVSTSPSQKAKLDSIQAIHLKWIDYGNLLIIAKKKEIAAIDEGVSYDELFEGKLLKEVGKMMNDEIAEFFRAFNREEYKVRQERRVALNLSISRTRNVSLVISILTFLFALFTAIYITRIISKRIKTMVEMAEQISKGKFKVIEEEKDKDELTDLSHSLNVMSKRLEKSFTELENKNKELDQFAYVVSHDLKAPLRGMYNISSWMEEDAGDKLSGELRTYMELLKGRIHRMESLINGLLEYAKVGRTKKTLETVDVGNLLVELETSILPKEFKLVLKGKMPVMNTEKIRLEQVFSNLISNAYKHDSKKTGTITVEVEDLIDFYKFSVIDKGDGIEPEYHEKIFDMFQTLREKDEVESTGVGLAIVKKIIEEQHGKLSVVSTPGEGSSFSFTWPKVPINSN